MAARLSIEQVQGSGSAAPRARLVSKPAGARPMPVSSNAWQPARAHRLAGGASSRWGSGLCRLLSLARGPAPHRPTQLHPAATAAPRLAQPRPASRGVSRPGSDCVACCAEAPVPACLTRTRDAVRVGCPPGPASETCLAGVRRPMLPACPSPNLRTGPGRPGSSESAGLVRVGRPRPSRPVSSESASLVRVNQSRPSRPASSESAGLVRVGWPRPSRPVSSESACLVRVGQSRPSRPVSSESAGLVRVGRLVRVEADPSRRCCGRAYPGQCLTGQ